MGIEPLIAEPSGTHISVLIFLVIVICALTSLLFLIHIEISNKKEPKKQKGKKMINAKTVKQLQEEYPNVREDCIDTLKRYVEEGCPTGGFLQAVLENDLKEAFGRADEYNRDTMFHIVSLIYAELPHNSWGSRKRVESWLLSFKKESEEE